MSLYCICVCVWKRSYLCTRCRRVFRDRYFFDDARENIAKRAGKRGELLVGKTENFFFMSRQGEWKWEVDDEDVTVGVIGAMEDILGFVK